MRGRVWALGYHRTLMKKTQTANRNIAGRTGFRQKNGGRNMQMTIVRGEFHLRQTVISLLRGALVAAAVLISGCKTQSAAYKISGGNGLTRQEAVVIQARNVGVGTAAELAWLKNHWRDHDVVTNQFDALAGHIYSVVTITSTNGETNFIYFDVTDPIRNSPRLP